MKRFMLGMVILLLTITGACFATPNYGKPVQITVKTPGSLPQLVQKNKYSITNLILSGTLNGTDLRCYTKCQEVISTRNLQKGN